eukprot:CAMPEP_0196995124 /NCGR_PEP_ID=MMETSP1380-20130617/1309_1 /TAXON_ID=5936 /ORGANISM="Euplotes crassus, Strain CT5" /LENGTH=204 /DNA_ID=CAMNT_0042410711 /DNA_START=227 /DNA_END=842 /DNA_ORIENTATION=-
MKQDSIKPEGEYIKSPFQEINANGDPVGGSKEQMSALPTDNTPNGYSNPAPPNPATASEGVVQTQEELKGNPDDANPSISVEALESKVNVLQNKIDSLKVLFTQVLERVNIVNQENNYLRSVIMQNNQMNQPASQHHGENTYQMQNAGTVLPSLNQTSINIQDSNAAEQNQQLIDTILPIFSQTGSDPNRSQLPMPFNPSNLPQ